MVIVIVRLSRPLIKGDVVTECSVVGRLPPKGQNARTAQVAELLAIDVQRVAEWLRQ